MGGAAASKTLLSLKVGNLEKAGKKLSDVEKNTILAEIQRRYDEQTGALYGAARLWTDGIIDPRHTRRIVSLGIEMAGHSLNMPKFNVGVLQT
jgi:acetyl-CoA carboxylase carboxyltransferase component